MRALAAVVLALPAIAHADADGFRLARFAPPPTPRDGLVVGLPATLGHLRYAAALTLELAEQPFVLVRGEAERDVVGRTATAHATFALGLGTRFQVHAALPVVAQRAEAGMTGTATYDAGAAALGDARIGGSVRALDVADLVVGARLDVMLPTGSPRDFTGDGGPGLEPHATARYALPRLALVGDASLALRPSHEFADARIGSEVIGRFGVHAPVGDSVRAMLELAAVLPLRDQPTNPPPPAELLAGASYRRCDLVMGGGVGVGLTGALGVPAWRALVTVGYVRAH